LLESYDGLKNPNDQFVYVDIQNQQDVLEDLARKRFEFLELRDNLKYILKFSDDFTNADGTPVDRNKLIENFDEVVAAINTMQDEASACTKDAGKCNFTNFDVSKFNLPNPKLTALIRVPSLMDWGLLGGSNQVPKDFTVTIGFRIDPPSVDKIAHVARQNPPPDSLALPGSTITIDYFWPGEPPDYLKTGKVYNSTFP
jgi:hypothetical protein